MRTRIISASSILVIFAVQSALPQCLTDTGEKQDSSKSDRMNLYSGEQAFTLNLLDAINKATPNENIFFSPYSTYHALLLAYFGSRNKTETYLRKGLHLNWSKNKYQVMQAYRYESQMRAKRSQNSSLEFNAADKIYVSKEAELRPCIKNLFHEELETLDFANQPEESRVDINKWVEGTTRGHIKDILVPGTISKNTKMVLANAAYFKGQWASKFNSSNTKKGVFHSTQEKQSLVDMMYIKGNFNLELNEALGAHILELPYEGEDSSISMIIFLPPFMPNSLDNVLSRLTPEILHEVLSDSMSREMEIKLPRFTFEKSLEFRPILEKIVGNIFDDSADYSAFSEKTKLSIDDAIHKAKIEVNEEGSTAAAATVLFSFRSSRPLEPTQFFCDHPFLFLIYDSKAEAVLFAGIYRGPDN